MTPNFKSTSTSAPSIFRRMGLRFSVVSVAGLCSLGLCAFGLIQAQTAPTGDDEVVVPVRVQAASTPEEQLTEARAVVARGQQLSERTTRLLSEARREGDMIRVTCLDDKLTQINAQVRSAEGRLTQLEGAVAVSDVARSNHEFTVMTVMNQNFLDLGRDTSECVGDQLFDTGRTRVTTEISPTSPEYEELPPQTPPSLPIIPPPVSATF